MYHHSHLALGGMLGLFAAGILAAQPASAQCVPSSTPGHVVSCHQSIGPVQQPVKIGPVTHRVPTQKEIDLYNSPQNEKNRPKVYPSNSNVTLGIREVPAGGAQSTLPRSAEAKAGRARYCAGNPGRCGE